MMSSFLIIFVVFCSKWISSIPQIWEEVKWTEEKANATFPGGVSGSYHFSIGSYLHMIGGDDQHGSGGVPFWWIFDTKLKVWSEVNYKQAPEGSRLCRKEGDVLNGCCGAAISFDDLKKTYLFGGKGTLGSDKQPEKMNSIKFVDHEKFENEGICKIEVSRMFKDNTESRYCESCFPSYSEFNVPLPKLTGFAYASHTFIDPADEAERRHHHFYIFGGYSGDSPVGIVVNDFWRFDADYEMFTLISSSNKNVTRGGSTTSVHPPAMTGSLGWIYDNHFYLFGGLLESSHMTNILWKTLIYDPSSDQEAGVGSWERLNEERIQDPQYNFRDVGIPSRQFGGFVWKPKDHFLSETTTSYFFVYGGKTWRKSWLGCSDKPENKCMDLNIFRANDEQWKLGRQDDQIYPEGEERFEGHVWVGEDHEVYIGFGRNEDHTVFYDKLWRLNYIEREETLPNNDNTFIGYGEYDKLNNRKHCYHEYFTDSSRQTPVRGDGSSLNEMVCPYGCFDRSFQDMMVCGGKGKCREFDVCECNNNELWGGEACETEKCNGILSTETNVCSGMGTCTFSECLCSLGWCGEDCDLLECNGECTDENSNGCGVHGRCLEGEDGGYCVCEDDYFGGESCELPKCYGMTDSEGACSNLESRGICAFVHDGSEIVGSECKCKKVNGVGYLGEECEYDECIGQSIISGGNCGEAGMNAICVNNKCECKLNYYPIEEYEDNPTSEWKGCEACYNEILLDLHDDSTVMSNKHCPGEYVCVKKDQNHYFSCSLQHSYSELHCFGILSTETDEVCSSHGDCIKPDVCECWEGYYGEECELFTCRGFPKDHPDACYGEDNHCVGYDQCDCVGEMSEEFCEPKCYNFEASDPNVCNNHGSCESTDHCVCERGWSESDFCATPLCENQYNCNGHGVCKYPDICLCEDNYFGSDCSKKCSNYVIDINDPHQCFHVDSTQKGVCGGVGECVGEDYCVVPCGAKSDCSDFTFGGGDSQGDGDDGSSQFDGMYNQDGELCSQGWSVPMFFLLFLVIVEGVVILGLLVFPIVHFVKKFQKQRLKVKEMIENPNYFEDIKEMDKVKLLSHEMKDFGEDRLEEDDEDTSSEEEEEEKEERKKKKVLPSLLGRATELGEDYRSLQLEYEKYKIRVDEEMEEVKTSWEEELKKQKKENEKLKESVEELEKEAVDLNQECEQYQTELERITDEIRVARKRVEEERERARKAVEDMEVWKRRGEEAEKRRDEAKSLLKESRNMLLRKEQLLGQTRVREAKKGVRLREVLERYKETKKRKGDYKRDYYDALDTYSKLSRGEELQQQEQRRENEDEDEEEDDDEEGTGLLI